MVVCLSKIIAISLKINHPTNSRKNSITNGSEKNMHNIQKISVSLAKPLFDFVDDYQKTHNCKSRSEVINRALYLLQQLQLENCYREANKEIDQSYDVTSLDGLENATW